MHADVKKLLALQNVDQMVARLRKEIESIPAEKTRREAHLAELRQGCEAKKAAVQSAELRSRELELSIKQSDGEVKNLEGKLGAIKNNAEYQAILFQIEAVKKERDGYEEELLVLLDKVEPLRDEAGKVAELLRAEELVYEEFKTEADRLIARQEAEIARVATGREELVSGISIELMDDYGRLFAVRGGLAVCRAEGQFCQGCYKNITMNDLARLRGGSMVVRCGSCQRILFLDE